MELTAKWTDDWEIGSHFKEYGEAYTDADGQPSEPDTCEGCQILDEKGRVWASLGCIDDANGDYKRRIEHELILEARYEIEQAALRTLSASMAAQS